VPAVLFRSVVASFTSEIAADFDGVPPTSFDSAAFSVTRLSH
jgi:hypothetical protein